MLQLRVPYYCWPWMRDRGEQTIAGLGLEMLKNPEALDAFIEALVGSLENFSLADDRDPKAPKVTENRNFSPALRLITEAVSGYRKTQRSSTFYKNQRIPRRQILFTDT